MMLQILGGAWAGLRSCSFFFATYLAFAYMGKRSDAKDIKTIRWYMLIIPGLVLFVEADRAAMELIGKSTPYIISFFAIFLLFAWTGISIALTEYNRKNDL